MSPPDQHENTALVLNESEITNKLPVQHDVDDARSSGTTEGQVGFTNSVLQCARVQDWLQPVCTHYSGLRVPREQASEDIQHDVDALARSGVLGPHEKIEESIPESVLQSDSRLAAELSEVAQRVLDVLSGSDLPESMRQQIQRDIEEVGSAVAKMCPSATELTVSLQTMGEMVCPRWHQDIYIGRAIICYNGSGTNYVNNDNVNFGELENCSNNEHIVSDPSQALSVNTADILFMKGNRFPGAARGLVHKSPDKRYHADGAIMNRLCLKVDLPAPSDLFFE